MARLAPFGNMRASLVILALFISAIGVSGSTLTTPSYKITIEVRCPEGSVTCDDVKYVGVSRISGKSITLIGRTVHATAADGVTPTRFLGCEFKSGSTTYFVSEDGGLAVTRDSKLLVDEKGVWEW